VPPSPAPRHPRRKHADVPAALGFLLCRAPPSLCTMLISDPRPFYFFAMKPPTASPFAGRQSSTPPKPPFLFHSQPHRQAPLPRALVALKSHAVVGHRGPLPQVRFESKRRRHPPHSVSSTLSGISSLLGTILTLSLLAGRSRPDHRSPPPTGRHR
jgi:hypothetical protein